MALIDKIVKQGLGVDGNAEIRDHLHVDWTFTKACNYRCSYCFDRNSKKKPEGIDELWKYEQTVDNIIGMNRPYYTFRLLGGEPTLFPFLLKKIINRIYSKTNNANIMMITNGSADTGEYLEIFREVPPRCADIHISVHFENCDIEHILDVTSGLAYRGFDSVNLRLMFLPGSGTLLTRIVTLLEKERKNYPFTAEVKLLRGGDDFQTLDSRYTEEELRQAILLNSHFSANYPWNTSGTIYKEIKPIWVFDDGSKESFKYHSNAVGAGAYNLKGFWCCPGFNTLSISPDFSWRGGTCPAFAEYKNKIFSENWFFPSEPVQCPYDICGCDANQYIPKFRNEKEAWELIAEKVFKKQ